MTKALLKSVLAYRPSPETQAVRDALACDRVAGRPYLPPYEGDLIHRLVTRRGYRRCLETGFGTGSSALYMLAAVAAQGGGSVTSIDFSDTNFNDLGRSLLETSPHRGSHQLIEENSNLVLPRLFAAGHQVDFAFLDGWKTFDHLAMELYYVVRMLTVGGAIMFDDSYLPSVRRAGRLLTRYFGFEELDYRSEGEPARLALWFAMVYRSRHRPYRVFIKSRPEAELPVTRDWHFDRALDPAITL